MYIEIHRDKTSFLRMLYNKILSLFHLIIASNNITPKTDLSSFGNGNELLSIVF